MDVNDRGSDYRIFLTSLNADYLRSEAGKKSKHDDLKLVFYRRGDDDIMQFTVALSSVLSKLKPIFIEYT